MANDVNGKDDKFIPDQPAEPIGPAGVGDIADSVEEALFDEDQSEAVEEEIDYFAGLVMDPESPDYDADAVNEAVLAKERADAEKEAARRAREARKAEALRMMHLEASIAELSATTMKYTKVPPFIGNEVYFKMLERPVKKPSPQDEGLYISKIIEPYDWNPNHGETVFVNTGSANFNAQFEKARLAYVQLEQGEFPILLYDKTVRMTAKVGFCLTNKYLHVHTSGVIPYKIRIFRIQKVLLILGETEDDWCTLSIKQRASHKIYPVFRSLDAERSLEIADVLMRMFYHLTPSAKLEFSMKGHLPVSDADFEEDEKTSKEKKPAGPAKPRRHNSMVQSLRFIFVPGETVPDKPAPVWKKSIKKKKPPQEGGEGQQ